MSFISINFGVDHSQCALIPRDLKIDRIQRTEEQAGSEHDDRSYDPVRQGNQSDPGRSVHFLFLVCDEARCHFPVNGRNPYDKCKSQDYDHKDSCACLVDSLVQSVPVIRDDNKNAVKFRHFPDKKAFRFLRIAGGHLPVESQEFLAGGGNPEIRRASTLFFIETHREIIHEISRQVIEVLAVFSVRTHKRKINFIGSLYTHEFIYVVNIFIYIIEYLSAVNDLHIVIRSFDAAVDQCISSASSVHCRGNIFKHPRAVRGHIRIIFDPRSHAVAERDFAILYFDNAASAQFADGGVSQLRNSVITCSCGQVCLPLALVEILSICLINIIRDLLGCPEYSFIPYI